MLNRLRIRTKIGASFALGLVLFVALAALSYREINRLIDRSRWQNHTYRVLAQLTELEVQLATAESGVRGYVILGDRIYLEPYETALQQLEQALQELRQMTQDNENQQQQINELESLIRERIEVFRESIRRRQQGGITAVQQFAISSGQQGRRLTETIRGLIAEMEAEEQRLLAQRSEDTEAAVRHTLDSVTIGVPVYSVLLILIGYVLSRNISQPLQKISEVANRVGAGDLTERVPVDADRHDEIGALTQAFNQMIVNLRETTQRNDQQNWLKSNLAEFSRLLQGQRNQETVARRILSELAPLVGAQQGAFYMLDSDVDPPVLRLLGGYAYQERKHLSNQFHLGEGLVGQCALEKQRILLTNVPDDYIRISSGLGEASPLNIVVLPILFESQVTAVLEFASFQRFSDIHLTLLEQISESIGVVLNTIAADTRTNQLLQQSQALTEELQHQQDELRDSNRRLEEQTVALRESETLLKQQQEELQQTNEELQQLNEELEEKAQLLITQKQEVEQKNHEIDEARRAIEEKAEQLALSSRYKSEFLANMSHELRTPLNSLLILARLLGENGGGNLTEKQVEYSKTIYAAGNDLLDLINDILDLAKIESGTMSIEIVPVSFTELQEDLRRTFQQVAHNKGLRFQIQLDPALPPSLATDPRRLQQILKNLLANAFKFTEQGSVTLTIQPGHRPTDNGASIASRIASRQSVAQPFILFHVADTGIGIAPEQQKVIFEAFQQADGTTSRKYGGTGLGLSISRELAQLLGGHIELVSQPGQGSTFTLCLPQTLPQPSQQSGVAADGLQQPAPRATVTAPAEKPQQPAAAAPAAATRVPLFSAPFPNEISDDRAVIQPDDRVLLLIEDDSNFAKILLEMARQHGFKGLVAFQGTSGLAMARQYRPDAIMLDIRLPGMDGWKVLDRLKHDPSTRHIPVHILSVDEGQQRSLQQGAIAFLQKPVAPEALSKALSNIRGYIERQVKRLLVIEDDDVQARSIIELIGNGDVQSTAVSTGAAALAQLRSERFDCVVLDLGLPDMTGFDLIEQIKREPGLEQLPIVVYTGKDLTQAEETQLKRLAETIIVKDVRSPERLLDETTLFLHRVQANLPQPKRQILEQLHQADPILAHKKVLIVDDDVRNIFALTSLLERYEMQVLYAENGRDGIAVLQNNPDVDIVLMDVMMPEMDGYETTQAIRQQPQFRSLPVIALTAKAMQGDREKCLEAGASDYITKPVDTEQLLSLLRVWLYQ
jgi:hypothetical protein